MTHDNYTMPVKDFAGLVGADQAFRELERRGVKVTSVAVPPSFLDLVDRREYDCLPDGTMSLWGASMSIGKKGEITVG